MIAFLFLITIAISEYHHMTDLWCRRPVDSSKKKILRFRLISISHYEMVDKLFETRFTSVAKLVAVK